jgi:hypothetical protein
MSKPDDWPTIPADANPDDYDADAIWQAWIDAEESPDATRTSNFDHSKVACPDTHVGPK